MRRIQWITKEFIEVCDELEEQYVIKNYPQFKEKWEDRMTKKKYYERKREDWEMENVL